MKLRQHIFFWLAIYALFILMYKNAFESYQLSYYFASFLLPVAIGSSILFNYILVPKYLITKRYKKFILYFIYIIIGSAYLEIVVIFLALIFLAELNIQSMNPIMLDIVNMAMVIYAVVFAQAFLLTLRKYVSTEKALEAIKKENDIKKTTYLTVKSDRQNKRIDFTQLIYVESLADYVKLHLDSQNPIVTKQKISLLEKELPGNFLRVHRSFIVNTNHIESFNAESIKIANQNIRISRSYKQHALEYLRIR